MIKRKKLVLIDGNALVHRGFHALPPTLRSRKGELTNGVYGFTMILLKALEDLKPDYVAVAFDKGKPTERLKMYKDYKAKRIKPPQELYDQFPRVKEIVSAFNIPYFEVAGHEADDIIGTLSRKSGEHIETIIVTGDLDALQLVDPKTKVYTMKKGLANTMIYDESAVKQRYILEPSQLIDMKAIAGDQSDNIPGIKGIGQKGAEKLIGKFGTLEKLYSFVYANKGNEEKLKKRGINKGTLKKVLEGEDDAYLSKRLATIIKDIPVNFDIQKSLLKDYDRSKVIDLFSELDFKSLIKKIPKSERHSQKDLLDGEKRKDDKISSKFLNPNYVIIKNEQDFNTFAEELKKAKEFAFDVETDKLDSVSGKLVGISFSFKRTKAFYLPLGHALESDNFDVEKMLRVLKPIFSNEKINKAGHNLKYDISVLKNYGVEVRGVYFDTMIASYLLNPGSRSHSLDNIAFGEFGYEMMPIEELIGKGRNQMAFSMVKIDKAGYYSSEDADYTFRLVSKLKEKLLAIAKKQANKETKKQIVISKGDVLKVFKDIEMPLINFLIQMERTGVKIDSDFLKRMSDEYESRIESLKKEIYKYAGGEFNINSTKQLREVLFEKLKVSTEDIKKTKTGFSTSAGELEKLRDKHPIVKKLFEYRELAKLKNTYLDALPRLVNKKTGRVHTGFNQTITSTGRLSSSNPNLQNIPIRTEQGKRIRKAFIADEGCKLVSFDYSQIDLRVLAHYSKDRAFLESFKRGEDIHKSTAAAIFGVSPTQILRGMRRVAKIVNFGIVYGMSEYGLARTLKIDQNRAKYYIKKFFEKHPKIKEYMKEIVEFAKKHHYVETLFGRRRYLPEISSSQYVIRSSAERMAINMPIQGTAADIIKLAMVDIMKIGNLIDQGHKVLLQVHDELVFEVKKDKVKAFIPKIKKVMESVTKLSVPLVVNAKVGDNWEEME